jgi:ubiquitin C-terminal hydrolase
MDSLNKFFSSETREDINCDNCNSRNNCVYKTAISELPTILIVYFMRNTGLGVKCTDDLDVGLTHQFIPEHMDNQLA